MPAGALRVLSALEPAVRMSSQCKVRLAMSGNLGDEPRQTRQNDISLKCVQTGIKNNKLTDLLPTNNKQHKMETRV